MITTSIKRNYAVGAAANGVKTDMFTFFLLFFYTNIAGLEPALAGLAILVALCVDAVTDPLMGTISDRTNSVWGRRHPYMFISFIPISIGYILLFLPNPEWDITQTNLFLWMVSFTILTRVGMTLFDIPHRGLGAELTKDYEERVSIMSWRELFGWLAGIGNAFLGYFIFLRSTPEYERGMLNPDAYLPFAIAGAVIMIFSILYSSSTTLKIGKSLSKWTGSIALRDIFNELKIALSNRSFIRFFFINLTLAIAWGLGNALTLYVNTFFWQFSSIQITAFLPVYALCSVFAFYLTPGLTKRFDKKYIVMVSLCFVSFFSLMPFTFYNLGLTPDKGSWMLIPFLSSFLIFGMTFNVVGIMTRDSMLGDISDEVELQSGKRQEGILYAAISFMGKVNTGLGSFTAGLALSLISFKGSDSSENEIYSLLIIQGPVVACLILIPAFMVYNYKITRKRHAEIILQLNNKNKDIYI
jgi:Na+/melibiose symporter-like transporter